MDFNDLPPTQRTREFQAVILAGFGNELTPLTSDNGDQVSPKALLPIANRPMLDYPLMWIEESGLRDVLLICPTSHEAAISHHLHSSSSFPSLSVDIRAYDESPDLGPGTATVLKHFAHLIEGDFVLLPCDFVPPPSLTLTSLLNQFRTSTGSDGTLMTTCFYEFVKPSDKSSVPDDWGAPAIAHSIVYDPTSATLLHIDTPDDADQNSGELELRMALIQKYPHTILTSKLLDTHVYVCRRAVLDALQQKPHLESLKEEFLPWLCKIQYQAVKRQKYGAVLDPITNRTPQALALQHSTLPSKMASLSLGASSPLSVSHMSSHGAPTIVSSRPPSPSFQTLVSEPSSLRVSLILHRLWDGYTARANNIYTYLELNRSQLSQKAATGEVAGPELIPSGVDPKAQVSLDCLIGDSTTVGPRTTIKKSIIGKHCVIGQMAKITGCVLLDHCVVEDGVRLDGCLLGKGTKVGAKAKLAQCVIQPGFEVEADGTYNKEKLETSDWAEPGSDEDGEGTDDASELSSIESETD